MSLPENTPQSVSRLNELKRSKMLHFERVIWGKPVVVLQEFK